MSLEAFRIQVHLANPVGTSDTDYDPLDQLLVGASTVPIIAASNKTPVTQNTGGLEMHPLFITIGNIDSDICMKATFYIWQYVAFVPMPKFETYPDYQIILQAQL